MIDSLTECETAALSLGLHEVISTMAITDNNSPGGCIYDIRNEKAKFNRAMTSTKTNAKYATICKENEIKSDWMPSSFQFENICIQTKKTNPATITIPQAINVKSLAWTHTTGQITCRGKDGLSNWGCAGVGVGLVMTRKDDPLQRIVLPKKGMPGLTVTQKAGDKAFWYKMSGVTKDSTTMVWSMPQGQKLPAGTYQVWYNEDLGDYTEADNSGKACYDMVMSTHEAKVPAPTPGGGTPAPPTPAPPGGVKPGKATVKGNFHFYKEKATWHDALAACQNLGLGWSLALIGSKTDNDQVASLVNAAGAGQTWIGYHDQIKEKRWQWVAGTSKYTNWNTGEPNNAGNEDCGSMWGKPQKNTWNDAGCNNKFPFVCDSNPSAPTPSPPKPPPPTPPGTPPPPPTPAPTSPPAAPGEVKFYGKWVTGDDTKSTAVCPSAYPASLRCRCEGICDGAWYEDNNGGNIAGRGANVCAAFSAGPQQARAVVYCSKDVSPAFTNVASVANGVSCDKRDNIKDYCGGAKKATCPAGTTVQSCSCHSYWKACPPTEISPSTRENSCKLTTKGKARVYARCHAGNQDMFCGDELCAYWEEGDCGKHGDDFHWDWCNKQTFDCKKDVSVPTSQCPTGVATLVDTVGTGSRDSFTTASCSYYYYATYKCSEPWEYLACFLDDRTHDLAFHAPATPEPYNQMTCMTACMAKNYKYFGLQKGLTQGSNCFCDNDYGTPFTEYPKTDDADCGAQGLGGIHRNAIYRAASTAPIAPPSPTNPSPTPSGGNTGGNTGGSTGGKPGGAQIDNAAAPTKPAPTGTAGGGGGPSVVIAVLGTLLVVVVLGVGGYIGHRVMLAKRTAQAGGRYMPTSSVDGMPVMGTGTVIEVDPAFEQQSLGGGAVNSAAL